MNYLSQFIRGRTIGTPQMQPQAGKDQIENRAGGYVYAIDPWERVDRFLILGSERGTYYVGERLLHIACVLDFVTIHFQNDVALLQSSIISRAARLHLLDHRPMDIMRSLKLLLHLWREIAQAEPPAHFSLAAAR